MLLSVGSGIGKPEVIDISLIDSLIPGKVGESKVLVMCLVGNGVVRERGVKIGHLDLDVDGGVIVAF